MFPRRPTRRLVAMALSLAAIGCSKRYDDLPREPVSGTVTMDGQPLDGALIQFSPAGDAKDAVVGANAEVAEGKFSIPREDGLVPGSYKVSISQAELKDYVPKGKKASTPSSIPSRTKKLGPERIPARYNAKTELKADIKPGAASDLKFDLQSK